MKPLLAIVTARAAFVLLFSWASCGNAQNWTQTTASTNEHWRTVACSADGSRIVAASLEGIQVSTNSGGTWSLSGAPEGQSWSSVASSADGTRLASAVDGGAIYFSADGGVTWNPSDAPSASWQGVACSADGTRMVAVYGTQFSTGGIYISTNAGAAWTTSNAPTNGFGWYAVASSADGTKLAAMMVDALTPSGPYGWIYTSSNAAATWIQTARIRWPCSLASSADGRTLVAATGAAGPLRGSIQTSTDSGATWTAANLPTEAWSSVASSADGTRLVAAIGGFFTGPITGPIYTSSDLGTNWTVGDSPTDDWASVASSADGCKQVAAINGGGIYTRQTMATPSLIISLSGTNLDLSWTVPSMKFLLRQNVNLGTEDWTDVPVIPTLDYATLEYRATIPAPAEATIYRLVAQ